VIEFPDLKCAISRICMYHFIVPSCCLHSGIWTIQRSKEKNAFMLQYNYIPIVICNIQLCPFRGLGNMVFNATFNNISVISWWPVLLVLNATFNNVSGIRYNMVNSFIGVEHYCQQLNETVHHVIPYTWHIVDSGVQHQ
jgi:hypothetical protein